MKKTIFVASFTLLLAAAPAMAQMMGSDQDARSNQQMMNQQQMQQIPQAGGQNYSQYMNPGMMGGYGMGPGMMGGHGMGSGMMGGYGMGPGMMGGCGMGSGMMGGYGMGHGMMGGYGYGVGPQMMNPEAEKQYKEYNEKNNRFLDDTKELRKELHSLKFEYHEALRSTPEPNDKLDKMRREMFDLQLKISNKRQKIK
jgi:hypothetical protein